MRQLVRASTKVRQRSQEAARILRDLPHVLAPRPARRPSDPVRLRFVYRDLGAPMRYRVAHQVEQATLAGLSAHALPLDAPRLYDLRGCDVLYLHRLPLAPPTIALCLAARRHHIAVIFDSDDLVWDPREREYNHLDHHYNPEQVARFMWATRRTQALMRYADAFVFATPYLAQLAAEWFEQPAYVNLNAVSLAMLSDAEVARAEHARRSPSDEVVIGYFCGSPRVHDEDLASIGSALAKILQRYPDVRLRIYGELRLLGTLAQPLYQSRIEMRPAVGWRQLPHEIAQIDINIAPLADNPQRRAKSAVKYLEAALVGVPTVASRFEPYQDAIADGESGLLAASSGEWERSLTCLIEHGEVRHRLGAAAWADVLARHTTASRAQRFAAIIMEVAA